MRIRFEAKDDPSNEVYVGQVRMDESGVFAIVSHSRMNDEDKPFNAYLITENEDSNLYGVINWSDGTDADGIRMMFPTAVDAELVIKGEK